MKTDIRFVPCTEGFIDKIEFCQVHVRVEFTDTEIAVIERQRLGSYILVDRIPREKVLRKYGTEGEFKKDQWRYALKVEDIVNRTDIFECENMLAAMEYRNALEEKLQLLALNIEAVVREIS